MPCAASTFSASERNKRDAPRHGRPKQLRHTPRAAGLAEDGHPRGVPTERRDVRLHPFQGGDVVQQTVVAGGTPQLVARAESVVCQETQAGQSAGGHPTPHMRARAHTHTHTHKQTQVRSSTAKQTRAAHVTAAQLAMQLQVDAHGENRTHL
jgi:hypothetical protein